MPPNLGRESRLLKREASRPLQTGQIRTAALSHSDSGLPHPPPPASCHLMSLHPKCGKPSNSIEALSWTEYRQALADLSPTFRRHGITTPNSGKRTAVGMAPAGTNHGIGGSRHRTGGCSSPNAPPLADERYRDPWEDVVDRTESCTSPLRQRYRSLRSGEEDWHRGDGVGDCPPRSPGADSYGVLRRKRQAAVSLDYEGITKQLPQVGLRALLFRSWKSTLLRHS